MARDACDELRKLGFAADRKTGVLQGELVFAEPGRRPTDLNVVDRPPNNATRVCTSEWIFDHEHRVWKCKCEFDAVEKTGATHTVASIILDGCELLVDWGTRQFKDVPAEARLFM